MRVKGGSVVPGVWMHLYTQRPESVGPDLKIPVVGNCFNAHSLAEGGAYVPGHY